MRRIAFLMVAMFCVLPAFADSADLSVRTLPIDAACANERPKASQDLWLAHFDQYLASRELTVEQRALVIEARDLMANGVVRKMRSSNALEAADAQAALASFESRAMNVFSAEAYAEAFVRPGKRFARGASLPGAGTSAQQECNCNWYTGECGDSCTTGGCIAMPEGCGTMGSLGCFGFC